ncbi:phytanoyl-CoA dioxygenase family protein [Actinomadura sediminis]|uniref:Phytanoyl-CoA dioxygenase family protein n=1 Tax=Actinomadura sediminis TaxID=1038904 RepID=A0ABW3ER58_9ACTN
MHTDAPPRPYVDRYAPITDADRRAFAEQGYLLIRGALDEPLRAEIENAVDRVYAAEERAGRLSPHGAMHTLGAVFRDEAFTELLDLPATFPHLWGHLGWNIYVHHSHIDVNPPVPDDEPPAWRWHQDGYRQNADLAMEPRPMFSIKVAYVLSDLSEPGRGGTLVLPGSQYSNTLERTEPGPDGHYPRPPGTVEISARPGDAFLFDRRLWHSRSPNLSAITRKMVFLCYTYRWIRWRDDVTINRHTPWWNGLTPLRRQLLGDGDEAASHFGFTLESGVWDDAIPLRAALKSRGLLDHSQHYLR